VGDDLDRAGQERLVGAAGDDDAVGGGHGGLPL
jgi:hypothetical protein